jgi:hypothetical protein
MPAAANRSVLLALFASLPLMSQSVCPSPGFLGRGVEARVIGTPGALHWFLPAIPSENDVNIIGAVGQPDKDTKDALMAAFRKVQDENRPITLELQAQDNLGVRMKKFLPGGATFAIVSPSDILKRPAAPQAAADLCVKINLRLPAARPPITDLSIHVATDASALASAPGRKNEPVNLQDLDSSVPAMNVTVEYVAEDLDQLTPDQVRRALSAVALRAYLAAKTRSLIPGKPAPLVNDSHDKRLAEASSELAAAYRLRGTALGDPKWPEPDAQLEFTSTNPPKLQFTIKRVQVAAAAHAQVIFDGKFTVLDPDKGNRLRERESRALDERFESTLNSLAGTVPTQQAVLNVVQGLSAATEIAVDAMHKISVSAVKPPREVTPKTNTATPATPPIPAVQTAATPAPKRVLWFVAFHQWKNILGFKTKGEIGYSPEQRFLGGGDFSGDNLIRLRETETFELKAGNRVGRGSASLIVDRHKKVQYGARADGKFVYNSDQQFGNLLGPKLRARDWSITPKTYLNYPFIDPNQPTAPLGFSTTSAAGLEFHNVKVNAETGPAPPDSSGNATAVFVNLGPYYSLEPQRTKGGIGRFGIGVDFTGRQSLPGLGADFDYRQLRLSGSVELFFGFAEAKDILLRHKRGAGFSDGRVPLFALQRLGGTGSVRGIEEGEYVGRDLGFEQYDGGVTIRPLWNWIASLKKKDASKPEARKASFLNPSTTYFKLFYDRGVVRDHASLGEVLGMSHTKFGYGFEVEASSLSVGGRQASLSLGYGKSPQSVLHTSGIALVEFVIKR